jgi:hypothetical protein
MGKHSAALAMAVLALIFMGWHFGFGWTAFRAEAIAHGDAATLTDYLVVWGRDTTENLQSEFWQLAVQFLVLAGALKVVGVRAYEEDVEKLNGKIDDLGVGIADLNDRLDRLGKRLP